MPASKEYFQQYYLARKRKLMVILGGVDYRCTKCGYRGDDLEFDHIDPETKLFTIGVRIMQSWKKPGRYLELLDELRKCQLLCTGCHLAKTKIQLSVERGFEHGTMYGWMKKHCKCALCETAKSEYQDRRNVERRQDRNEPRGPYGLPAEHGTYKRYKRGCTCPECKAANAQKARELRAAK